MPAKAKPAANPLAIEEQRRIRAATDASIDEVAGYFVRCNHGEQIRRPIWDNLVNEAIKKRLGYVPAPTDSG